MPKSLDDLVLWCFVAAWIGVLGLILFVLLPRIVFEVIRIVKRLLALVNDSELPAKFAQAQADTDRIQRSLDQLPVLQQRAAVAVTTIRTTKLVPPAIGEFVARTRAQLRAFREELRGG